MSSQPATIPFSKGHGTENDFIIIFDRDASYDLSPSLVASLCDRRAGIGADGVLRVVSVGAMVEAARVDRSLVAELSDDDWFMDYRNADGSIAEMCGNGTRVFAHYLRIHDLVDTDEFSIGTRAGARKMTVHSYDSTRADVSVDMGPVEVTGVSTCSIADHNYAGMGIDVGNPHLACVVPQLQPEQLWAMEFPQPVFDHEFFPEGVNVEVLTQLRTGPEGNRTSMRVFERGVGETRSCGTGTVAAAQAVLADAGMVDGKVDVEVPGGVVTVTINGETSTLRGPSRIIADGRFAPAALS